VIVVIKKEIKELSKAEINKIEITRKNLMANLFGKKVIAKESHTYWEEMTCLGFNPLSAQLEAVVSVKRETGYSGVLCSYGSTEYVRFFVDWGTGFENVGLTNFKVYDISDLPPGTQHPLQYMVYLPLEELKYKDCCDTAVLPKVRAVLSWNQIPSLDPNDPPYYGNRVDAEIQIQPKDASIACMIKKGLIDKNLAILNKVDSNASLPKIKSQPVPWNNLITKYREAKVPDHRVVYHALYPLIKGGGGLLQAQSQIDQSFIDKYKIDVSKNIDLLTKTNSNTTFEEVICAGLNTASDTLGGVIHVKRSNGYSGNLCDPGSKEYVAFWADWNNNGTYDEYLGTAIVDVHDISNIPAGGLYYGVLLPANFTQHLKESCKQPNIIGIRAVLSWNVPPSTTDPNDLNYWGNRIDVVVQIRPGKGGSDLMDLIYDIGNVPIDNISPSTFLANPSSVILAGCSQPAMDRPFGGAVRIGGRIYNTGDPGSVRYQIQYAPHGSGAWLPVTNTVTFELMHPDPLDPLHPSEFKTENSPDGWICYDENPGASPPLLERTSLLAWWNTGSMEGVYDLRLVYTKDYPITLSSFIHYSDIVTIVLDNTNFTVSPTPNANVDTAYMLDLVIDGGDCHSYLQDEIIKGHLRALDKDFWKWQLELQPTTHFTGSPVDKPCRSYGSLVDEGDENAEWNLDTSMLEKCGYTLTLWAHDRTIVNSNGAIVHWDKKAIGFSVK
jgi:hypothetical protein